MTSGEKDMDALIYGDSDSATPRGALSRTIEIKVGEDFYVKFGSGKKFTKETFSEFIKDFNGKIREDYGHMAPQWLSWIESNLGPVYDLYDAARNRFRTSSEPRFRLMYVTALLIEEWLSIDLPCIKNYILELADQFETTMQARKDLKRGESGR